MPPRSRITIERAEFEFQSAVLSSSLSNWSMSANLTTVDIVECQQCGESMATHALKRHIRKTHQAETVCALKNGKTVTVTRSLDGFGCPVCHKKYVVPGDLQRHTLLCEDGNAQTNRKKYTSRLPPTPKILRANDMSGINIEKDVQKPMEAASEAQNGTFCFDYS